MLLANNKTKGLHCSGTLVGDHSLNVPSNHLYEKTCMGGCQDGYPLSPPVYTMPSNGMLGGLSHHEPH